MARFSKLYKRKMSFFQKLIQVNYIELVIEYIVQIGGHKLQ